MNNEKKEEIKDLKKSIKADTNIIFFGDIIIILIAVVILSGICLGFIQSDYFSMFALSILGLIVIAFVNMMINGVSNELKKDKKDLRDLIKKVREE